jgi:hypothetical protein
MAQIIRGYIIDVKDILYFRSCIRAYEGRVRVGYPIIHPILFAGWPLSV